VGVTTVDQDGLWFEGSDGACQLCRSGEAEIGVGSTSQCHYEQIESASPEELISKSGADRSEIPR
jgi:hypothetical protein